MFPRGPAIIRNINRFDVLQTIRLRDNLISRSELSERTGLSQATISSIVGHLIGEGALIADMARSGMRGALLERGEPDIAAGQIELQIVAQRRRELGAIGDARDRAEVLEAKPVAMALRRERVLEAFGLP